MGFNATERIKYFLMIEIVYILHSGQKSGEREKEKSSFKCCDLQFDTMPEWCSSCTNWEIPKIFSIPFDELRISFSIIDFYCGIYYFYGQTFFCTFLPNQFEKGFIEMFMSLFSLIASIFWLWCFVSQNRSYFQMEFNGMCRIFSCVQLLQPTKHWFQQNTLVTDEIDMMA